VDAVVEDVVDRVELGFDFGRRFERSSTPADPDDTAAGSTPIWPSGRRAGADFRDGVRARESS
jgi:hypothetical protein